MSTTSDAAKAISLKLKKITKTLAHVACNICVILSSNQAVPLTYTPRHQTRNPIKQISHHQEIITISILPITIFLNKKIWQVANGNRPNQLVHHLNLAIATTLIK
jgi:hypothetical protein